MALQLEVVSPAFQRRPDMPLVSIVTPSYNQGRFIRETIESVLAQDYPNIEYIVVDGGSHDETHAICAEYADRLTFVCEEDRGQSDAINKGFRMARGEIVAWLNSDDLFLPGAVSRVVEAFLREPELGAAYGEGYQIDGEGNVKQRFTVTEPFNLWKLVYVSDYILQQTTFFRREVLTELGLLDPDLHYGMDWEILMRIGKRYMLRYLPYYMGSIREHGEAKTSTGGTTRFWELVQIMRRHGRMRYPPGFLVYGIETYQRVLNGWIERLFRGPFVRVGRKLQALVAFWSDRLMHRTIRECQGLYADGWASKRLRYMLPPGHGRFLEVEISLPHGILHEQTLEIFVGRQRVGSETFLPGEYRLAIKLPESLWNQTLEFTIRARRSYRAFVTDEVRDRRKLCYQVRRIGYSMKFANPSRARHPHEMPKRNGARRVAAAKN